MNLDTLRPNKENKSNIDCVNSKTHEFKFGEKTETETCLRTHEISRCLHCNQSYDIIMARMRKIYYTNEQEFKEDRPICHCHIWRQDGTCGSKLNFEDDIDGNNYGFERKPYGLLEIPERRKCIALRTK